MVGECFYISVLIPENFLYDNHRHYAQAVDKVEAYSSTKCERKFLLELYKKMLVRPPVWYRYGNTDV